MPWKGSVLSQRLAFVNAATLAGANISQLCRQFNISRDTGHRLIKLFLADGPGALADRSTKPLSSPARSAPHLEQLILALRDEHPAWGPRKLRRRLQNLGHSLLPAHSTFAAILKRHGRIDPAASSAHQPWLRFEKDAPNALWQMDFKGHFPLADGTPCHPLTLIDDHSRFSTGVFACLNQLTATVRDKLSLAMRIHGVPDAMLMDNGSCWGGRMGLYTKLNVWLMQLGIRIYHGKPYHPQTQGKNERFNRTLKAEVLNQSAPRDCAAMQARFNHWLPIYNYQRPHHALDLETPASRYKPSLKSFPEKLDPPDYGPSALVRKVQLDGTFGYNKRLVLLGLAFVGQPVMLQPADRDGAWDIYFASFKIARLEREDFQGRRIDPIRPHRYRAPAGETDSEPQQCGPTGITGTTKERGGEWP